MAASKQCAFNQGEGICPAQRMEPCQVQRFIGVNVAQTGQEALIEQQRFQLALMSGQHHMEIFGGKPFIQRFGAEFTQDIFRPPGHPNPPKLAGVVKCQLAAMPSFFKPDDQPVMLLKRVHFPPGGTGPRSFVGG